MKKFICVMKALSDPNRVKILKLLLNKEMCVCEIQSLLGLAQPTISKHLKVLEDADLLESRKDKQWVNYRAAKGSDSIYAERMLQELTSWLDDDPELQEMIEKLSSVDRTTLCLK
jgi:ArsR family transcriptional regulator